MKQEITKLKSKRQYLKESMTVDYCGETRFDYLDDDERPLIYKAMENYAKDYFKDKIREIVEEVEDEIKEEVSSIVKSIENTKDDGMTSEYDLAQRDSNVEFLGILNSILGIIKNHHRLYKSYDNKSFKKDNNYDCSDCINQDKEDECSECNEGFTKFSLKTKKD
jgi:hypothetical protein